MRPGALGLLLLAATAPAECQTADGIEWGAGEVRDGFGDAISVPIPPALVRARANPDAIGGAALGFEDAKSELVAWA